MIENENNLLSEPDIQEHEEPLDRTRHSHESPKYLPTLPYIFKSLVDVPIKIENEKPQRIIELLGSLLGVNDYKKNIAAFWFLDALALQLILHEDNLDDHYRSVLISWLAGEMEFIREKKLPRREFFHEMKERFNKAIEKMEEVGQLLHWDLIVPRSFAGETGEEEEEEDVKDTTEERRRSSILKESKKGVSKKSLQKRTSKGLKYFVDYEDGKLEATSKVTSPTSEKIRRSSTSMDPAIALDIVIESTYDTYADRLRYALVYAVFVEQIEVKISELPFVLRKPRPAKIAGSEPFEVRLYKKFRRDFAEEQKGGKRKKKSKSKEKKKKTSDIPITPPPSLSDEEKLKEKLQFILPLIQAKEAADTFEMHIGDK